MTVRVRRRTLLAWVLATGDHDRRCGVVDELNGVK